MNRQQKQTKPVCRHCSAVSDAHLQQFSSDIVQSLTLCLFCIPMYSKYATERIILLHFDIVMSPNKMIPIFFRFFRLPASLSSEEIHFGSSVLSCQSSTQRACSTETL